MKPILQTVLYGDNAIGNGNCVATAMASILEIPLWMMPPWESLPSFYTTVTGRSWSSDLAGVPDASVRRVTAVSPYQGVFTVDLMSGGSHSLSDQESIVGETAFTTIANWLFTYV